MKKLKIFTILIFSILLISGCSCTSSMCSSEDLNRIKENISMKYKGSVEENGKMVVDTKNEVLTEYEIQLKEEAQTKNITDQTEIENYVKQNIDKKINDEYKKHPKACLTITDMKDPESGATISGKSWGEAWKEGLLEGLIVYPISWMLISFANLFGGNGLAQILSIIITTIIIRLLMLILTFKSQIQTQKMQNIQAEISQISMKLKDPNLSTAEKNRLSMKIVEIYQKNGINPIASLIPTVVSMPIFLSVWSAVNQTLVIRTGDFLGLNLGQAVSSQVFSLNLTAIVLFLLMTASQILSMRLPNIIRMKQSNYKNKDQIKQANKQMATTMNIMLIMILITGFLLPSALAVYWTIGAIFSIIQTLVFQNSKVKQFLKNFGNKKDKKIQKAKIVK